CARQLDHGPDPPVPPGDGPRHGSPRAGLRETRVERRLENRTPGGSGPQQAERPSSHRAGGSRPGPSNRPMRKALMVAGALGAVVVLAIGVVAFVAFHGSSSASTKAGDARNGTGTGKTAA